MVINPKKDAINLMLSLGDMKILSNKNIKELFKYKNTSLWWFLYIPIYHCLEQEIIRIKSGKSTEKKEIKEKMKLVFGSSWFSIKNNLRKKLFRKTKLKDNKKDKILFLSSSKYWTDISDAGKKKKKGDFMLDPIVKKSRRQGYSIRCIDVDYSNDMNLNILKEKIKEGWVAFEHYETKDVKKKAKKAERKINYLWNKIRKNKRFYKHFMYKGHNLWPRILYGIEKLFKTGVVFRYVLMLETAQEIIKKENPKAIVIALETGQYSKALITAAREKAIPSIGVQHGMIYSNNSAYTNKKVSLSNKSIDNPITSKTAVYGKTTKNLLTSEGSYPPEAVVITGQPRYDSLLESQKNFNKDLFLDKYGLEKNKKIMLVTTQSFSNITDRVNFLRYTLRALKKEKDIQIIIKPKPVEDESFHSKILAQEKVEAKIMPKTCNIKEVLNACDKLITSYSTTALEAMILKKPVIIINLTGEKDPIPYVESGAAVGAYNPEEIKNAILKAKHNKKTKKFIMDWAYKSDRKATERVMNLIKKLIKNEKN